MKKGIEYSENDTVVLTSKKINWKFLFWSLRYTVNQILSNKLSACFIGISFVLCFLLPDTDIALLGHGILNREGAHWVGYLVFSLFYFASIADSLFKKDNLISFIKSLPINFSTELISIFAIITVIQIPILYLVFLIIFAALGFHRIILTALPLFWLINICSLISTKLIYNKIPFLVKKINLSPKAAVFFHFGGVYFIFLHVILFLRFHRYGFLRDIAILASIVGAFYFLNWNNDHEAVNFMFFIFSCLLISISRYVNLFKELDDEDIHSYWKTLPILNQTRIRYQLSASFILILPFWLSYLITAHSFLRSILLLILASFFIFLRKTLPKYAPFISLVLTLFLFLLIRYRL